MAPFMPSQSQLHWELLAFFAVLSVSCRSESRNISLVVLMCSMYFKIFPILPIRLVIVSCELRIRSRRKGASDAWGLPGQGIWNRGEDQPWEQGLLQPWNLLPTSYGHYWNARWNNAFHIGVFWNNFTL